MIHLGAHSYNFGVQRGNGNDVNIGNFSSIASGVLFDGGFNHDISLISTFPFKKIWNELKTNIKIKGDITIGNDIWIGEDAIIMNGITIGDGAVIGARTIVTKNIPPYAIMVGSPMRLTRFRFDQDIIAKLLKIEWWNWTDEQIQDNMDLFQNENIYKFINKFYKK